MPGNKARFFGPTTRTLNYYTGQNISASINKDDMCIVQIVAIMFLEMDLCFVRYDWPELHLKMQTVTASKFIVSRL